MKRDSVNYAVAGGFVVVMGVALLATLYALMGRAGAVDDYHIYFDNVSGMKFGTEVRYEGYRVGQVEAVDPEHVDGTTRYRVGISVRAGWPIPAGSRARVASSGLISALLIDIAGGAGPEVLNPGSEIPGELQVDLFAALSEAANDFRSLSHESLRPLAEAMKRELTGLMGDLRGLTNDSVRPLIETVSDQLADPALFEDLKAVTHRLSSVSGKLDAFLDPENLAKARELVQKVTVLAAELVQTNRRVQSIVDEDLDRGVGEVLANLGRFTAGLEQSNSQLQVFLHQDNASLVREALAKVSAAAQSIDSGALELGRLVSQPNRQRIADTLTSVHSLVEELRNTNQDARQLLGPDNRVQVSQVLSESESLLSELRETNASMQAFLDEENRRQVKLALGSVGNVARSLEEVSGTVADIASERNRRHVANILANVESASRGLGGVVRGLDQTRHRLDQVLGEVDTLVQGNSEHVSVAARDLRRALATLSEHVGAVSHHLEGSSRNMHEFTRQIRENPALLLSGSAQRDRGRASQ